MSKHCAGVYIYSDAFRRVALRSKVRIKSHLPHTCVETPVISSFLQASLNVPLTCICKYCINRCIYIKSEVLLLWFYLTKWKHVSRSLCRFYVKICHICPKTPRWELLLCKQFQLQWVNVTHWPLCTVCKDVCISHITDMLSPVWLFAVIHTDTRAGHADVLENKKE